MRNKICELLAGVICLISFTAEAGTTKFSNYNDLTINDRYIVVIGSKPSNARPPIIKQIHFDSIDTNIAQEVLDKSEGAYINVKELMKDDSGELVGKIYQAYDMQAILFFDAHKKKKQIKFRNNFLSNHFNHPKSSARFTSVYSKTNRTTEEKLNAFFRSNRLNPQHVSNDISAAQMSIANSKEVCETLRQASLVSDLMDVDYSGASGLKPSRSSISSGSVSASFAWIPIGAAITAINALLRTAHAISCIDVEQDTLTKDDVKELAKKAVDNNTFEVVDAKLKLLALSMTESIVEKVLGEDADLNSQQDWIRNILREIDQIYPIVKPLGVHGSSITAIVAASDIALLNFYYKLHEKASTKAKRYALVYIKERLRKTLPPLVNLDRERKKFLGSMKAYTIWKFPKHRSVWGICSTNHTGPYCKQGFKYGSQQKAQGEATRQNRALQSRHQKPRALKAVHEYAKYLNSKVSNMRSNNYMSFKRLKNNYNGYNLKNTISVHGEPNQKGWELELPVGSYDSRYFIGRLGYGDEKLSYSIPPSLIVEDRFGSDRDDAPPRAVYASDANLNGHNSAVRVKRINETVSIFEHHNQNKTDKKNMHGAVITKGASARIAPNFFHGKEMLSKIGMKARSISSVKVPKGYKVILGGWTREQGDWQLILNSDANLLGKYDNSTHSIRVEYHKLRTYTRIRNANANLTGRCLDAYSPTATNPGGMVVSWKCDGNSKVQQWQYISKTRQIKNRTGQCLSVSDKRVAFTKVKRCSSNDASQKWAFVNQQIRNDSRRGCLTDTPLKLKGQKAKAVALTTCKHDSSEQRWFLENSHK